MTITCYVKGSKYGVKLTRTEKHRPMTSYIVQFEIYRKDTVEYLVWVILNMPMCDVPWSSIITNGSLSLNLHGMVWGIKALKDSKSNLVLVVV